MQKPSIVVLISLLTVFLALMSPAVSCATITVGATPVPHGEILAEAVPILEEAGITLRIVEFNDYITPNRALAEGELDANFFQHQPYLDTYNADAGTTITSLAGIHVEPLGVYSVKRASLEDLPQAS